MIPGLTASGRHIADGPPAASEDAQSHAPAHRCPASGWPPFLAPGRTARRPPGPRSFPRPRACILAEPGRPGFHSFCRTPRAAAADVGFTGGSPLRVPPLHTKNPQTIRSALLSQRRRVSHAYCLGAWGLLVGRIHSRRYVGAREDNRPMFCEGCQLCDQPRLSGPRSYRCESNSGYTRPSDSKAGPCVIIWPGRKTYNGSFG